MATQSFIQPRGAPAHDRFYVVRHGVALVTVSHAVPAGAQELGSFDTPNGAIDFAELTVQSLRATGVPIELVDPPYGLVGAG